MDPLLLTLQLLLGAYGVLGVATGNEIQLDTVSAGSLSPINLEDFPGDAVRFLAVLVVATPCPLLIAIPVALIGSISLAAKRVSQ